MHQQGEAMEETRVKQRRMTMEEKAGVKENELEAK
jgi:hypothetical protein